MRHCGLGLVAGRVEISVTWRQLWMYTDTTLTCCEYGKLSNNLTGIDRREYSQLHRQRAILRENATFAGKLYQAARER